MSANKQNAESTEDSDSDAGLNEVGAFGHDIPEFEGLYGGASDVLDMAKFHEHGKKCKRDRERNDPLMQQCMALFPVPTTRAECKQQTGCEKDRVAAFEILLNELMRDIDPEAFRLFILFFAYTLFVIFYILYLRV